MRAADDDMVALNLIGIKRVQRLTRLMEHEVRYVHHVVDTPDTDCPQCVLQPFRRLVYADAFDAHARVTRAGISSLYADADRQVVALHSESVHRRLRECHLLTMRLIVSI